MRTARGLCAPVKCLLVSALHLFCLSLGGKKNGGLKERISHGVTLALRMAVGVLTRSTVGMCQVERPYYLFMIFFFSFGSINYCYIVPV